MATTGRQDLPTKTRYISIRKFAEGMLDEKIFEIKEKPLEPLEPGRLLIKTEYISIDPYLRGRLSGRDTYVPSFKPGEPIEGALVGRVIAAGTPSSQVKPGDYVGFMGQWADYQVRDEKRVRPLLDGVDPEAALAVVGMTGLTAFFGLEKIAIPKAGEVILITSAAGSVGLNVGMLAKTKGCRVIGLTGSEEKFKALKECGFDVTINYKQDHAKLKEEIKRAAPDGINIFWDNVGGEIADVVRPLMANFGRIVQCGAVGLYNTKEIGPGPRWEGLIVEKRLRAQGFIVFDYHDEFDGALKQLAELYKKRVLKKVVTVRQGFENAPKALVDLFHGDNIGKMIVKV